MPYNVRDALHKVTKALPAGAAATSSDPIDLGSMTARGDRLAPCELLLSAPVLAAAKLPDGQTVTYKIEHDDDPAFGTVTTIADGVIVQTGAGGVGAAAATFRQKIPSNCKRYVRATATKVGAADASGASMTLELLF